MPYTADRQVLLLLLSAAVAAPGGDSGRAGMADAATPAETRGARRTTPGTGAHDPRAEPAGQPKSEPVDSDDARGCSPGQAATNDRDRHLLVCPWPRLKRGDGGNCTSMPLRRLDDRAESFASTHARVPPLAFGVICLVLGLLVGLLNGHLIPTLVASAAVGGIFVAIGLIVGSRYPAE
jgi:hypothetical protein